jgi:TolA-binding protein
MKRIFFAACLVVACRPVSAYAQTQAPQPFDPDKAALAINQSAATLAGVADYWREQATQLQAQVGVLNRKIDELSQAQKREPNKDQK